MKPLKNLWKFHGIISPTFLWDNPFNLKLRFLNACSHQKSACSNGGNVCVLEEQECLLTYCTGIQVQVPVLLKGQSHEILYPRFFSLHCTPGSPDTWTKTVLHIDSNSEIFDYSVNSTKKSNPRNAT
jgi:hypothetical protein